MKKDISTEEKIKKAATAVFMEKGFSGCSTREIAKASGINCALVNYYFRSKSQLFELIFKTAMENFVLSMMNVFSSKLPLEDKMRIFIEKEYEFLSQHNELPAFILNELNRKDGCSIDHSSFFDKIAETGIFEECMAAQEEGTMKKMNLLSITLLIMSNSQYPVMSKKLMLEMHNLTEEAYAEQLLLHKQYVTEMLVSFLFPKK